jgi:hypothetical protein
MPNIKNLKVFNTLLIVKIYSLFYLECRPVTLAGNGSQLAVRAGGRDEVLSPDTNAKAKIQNCPQALKPA